MQYHTWPIFTFSIFRQAPRHAPGRVRRYGRRGFCRLAGPWGPLKLAWGVNSEQNFFSICSCGTRESSGKLGAISPEGNGGNKNLGEVEEVSVVGKHGEIQKAHRGREVLLLHFSHVTIFRLLMEFVSVIYSRLHGCCPAALVSQSVSIVLSPRHGLAFVRGLGNLGCS